MSYLKPSIILMLGSLVVGCAGIDAHSPYEDGKTLNIHVDHASKVSPDPHFMIPSGPTKPYVDASVKPPAVPVTE